MKITMENRPQISLILLMIYGSMEQWTINRCSFLYFFMCVHAQLLQSCPTLWDPRDCSLPGSSVCGILQARIQEWVVSSSSRGSSWPRDQTQISSIAGRFIYPWATKKFGEVNGNPLQYSSLENLRDRGAWWAAVYGVAQSRTRLKRPSSSSSSSI